MSQNITIVEIAKESGVSITTVSRVLNGSSTVSPKTKARVEEVIRKYGYKPNPMAKGLILHQSRSLGVIVPNITNPYFSVLFEQIERAASQEDYSVALCNTSFSYTAFARGENQREENYFRMMLDKKMDGVIIAGGQIDLCEVSQGYIASLTELASRIPLVVIGRSLPDIPCSFIDTHQELGVATAVRYLASLGHRRIAFVGGEPGVITTENRLNVYRSITKELNLDCSEELIATSDYYLADGYRSAKKLLNLATPVTAMLAMNDNVAIGAIRAITDYGLLIPEDIAVISCDQLTDGNYLTPRLTTLDRQAEQLGFYAIHLLLSKILGTEPPIRPDFSPELIIRESSGKSIRQTGRPHQQE